MTTHTPTHPSPPHHRVAWLVALVAAVLALLGVALAVARDLDNEGATTTVTHTLVGSGTPAVSARSVPAFTRVELAGANDVRVHVGGAQAVLVSGDDNLLPHVTTEVHDGTLLIAADRGFTTKAPMSVAVTVPRLDGTTLEGAGQMTVDGVRGGVFTASLPGTGTLRASGRITRLEARLGGSGELMLGALVARDASAVLSGTGRLHVFATRSLAATVSGTGLILYDGRPASVSTQVTGTGAVTHA